MQTIRQVIPHAPATLAIPKELLDRPIEVIIRPLATDLAAPLEPDLPPRQAGALKGRIKIAPDFNAPLEDFAQYES